MIKVLHVYNIMNKGGAETFVMNVYRNIDRSKIQFDFLCFKDGKGDFDDEIKSLGGSIYHLKQSKKKPYKSYKALINFFKKNHFDVIHLPIMFYSGVVAKAAKASGIKKVIVHSHSANDPGSNKLTRKIYIKICRKLINKYTDVKISCGKEAGKFLFGNLNNVLILNNGIDIDKFQSFDIKEVEKIKKQCNITDELVIGNVARFEEVKNHKFFIKLGEFIKENNLKIKIILVGDGSLRNDLIKETKEKELDNIIYYPGLRNDMPNFLSIFKVFVLPSLYEGFPVSIIESLASSTPCVVSNNVDKSVEIVKNMVEFVSLDNDIKTWYNKIIEISNKNFDKKEIKNILIKQNFDVKSTAKLLEDIYLK